MVRLLVRRTELGAGSISNVNQVQKKTTTLSSLLTVTIIFHAVIVATDIFHVTVILRIL